MRHFRTILKASILATGCCALLGVHPRHALADTIYSGFASAGYSAACSGNTVGPTSQSETETTPGTVSADFTAITCGGSGSASATIDAGNPNSVSATANTTSKFVTASSEAAIYGTFTVLGPQGQTVPVVVSASGSSTVSGTGGGTGSFGILPTNEINVGCLSGDNSCVSASAINGNGFSVNQTLFETTNLPIDVTAIASVSENDGTLYTYLFGPGSASVSVDPTIAIDPTFLASHPGYSLVFSAGYIPPVPLPPAAWLMLSGLFALGTLARKRIASH